MNKSLRFCFCTLFLALIASVSASNIHAQNIRTWVSGVGDDVNPCSRTAPCKTFAGAISKTQTGGEICAIDPGGYGSVTITKSITIDGTGFMSGVAANTVNGIIINITAANDTAKAVRLRGLVIDGYGSGLSGINVIAANSVVLEDSIVDGFTTAGITVKAGNVFVKNSTIRNNVTAVNVSGGQFALTNTDLVFNGTAFSGTFSAITWLNEVVLYGNKSGDTKPAGMR